MPRCKIEIPVKAWIFPHATTSSCDADVTPPSVTLHSCATPEVFGDLSKAPLLDCNPLAAGKTCSHVLLPGILVLLRGRGPVCGMVDQQPHQQLGARQGRLALVSRFAAATLMLLCACWLADAWLLAKRGAHTGFPCASG